MPELPEVETVRRSLAPRLVGRVVVGVETSGLALRRPVDRQALEAKLCGARCLSVERLGKHLLIPFERSSDRAALLVHLGMSGRLLFASPRDPLAPHTHVRLLLDEPDRQAGADQLPSLELRYVDPRRFGAVTVWPEDARTRCPELRHLGPDPLAADCSVAYLTSAFAGVRRDAKALLLDQTVLAGLGNIYVCEALFRAGISPRRRGGSVSARRLARLQLAIGEVLRQGIANGGTTLSDYVDADGGRGRNQQALSVYGRQGLPCLVCAAPVRRIVQAGRSTFYCGRCQR
jgi:formamidopyrimidine-DNA glycosylase